MVFSSKVKEYELSEVFHHAEDEQRYEVLKMEHLTSNTIDVLNGNNNNNDIETAIEEEREEQEIHTRRKMKPQLQQFLSPSPTASTSTTTAHHSTAVNRFITAM